MIPKGKDQQIQWPSGTTFIRCRKSPSGHWLLMVSAWNQFSGNVKHEAKEEDSEDEEEKAEEYQKTKRTAFLWNEKYQPLFTVNTEYFDGSYSVEILLPNKIEDREYKNSALFIDSLEEPSLFMPAEALERDEGKVVWYTVGNELVRKHFFVFSYGEGCGISVTLPVVFN